MMAYTNAHLACTALHGEDDLIEAHFNDCLAARNKARENAAEAIERMNNDKKDE